MATEQPYVLGTGDDELNRLALQHRLWSDVAHAAWKSAGLVAGQRVLDAGCGPGYASFDLAQMAGPRGAVVAVDESPSFISYLIQQAAARGLPQLRGVVADVQKLSQALADEAKFDLAYMRWVLCFVSDPKAVVEGIVSLLKPGGKLIVHDYFNYRSMTAAPRRASHDKVVAATAKSWIARGGDPDICGRLPGMLHAAGMNVAQINIHHRIARGGDTWFQWPYVWWHTFAPKLVAQGLFSQADCDELFRDLDEIAGDPNQFIECPQVYEIVAVSPAAEARGSFANDGRIPVRPQRR